MTLLLPAVASGMPQLDTVYCADALTMLKAMPSGCIDLTVTSPPYDNLRKYNGYSWDFEGIARQLYRVTKVGGVVVWVVGDATIDGSETLSSFKQAIYFKEQVGFRIHDTMIYLKNGSAFPSQTRYNQTFEYMFALSKGEPAVVNLQKEKSRWGGHKRFGKQSARDTDGQLVTRDLPPINEFKVMDNVWHINNGYGYSSTDDGAYEHPAIFPEQLAERHILTWSNAGDVILDPFMGSGTTAKMARANGRRFIGCDISQQYVDIAKRRLAQPYTLPMFA